MKTDAGGNRLEMGEEATSHGGYRKLKKARKWISPAGPPGGTSPATPPFSSGKRVSDFGPPGLRENKCGVVGH